MTETRKRRKRKGSEKAPAQTRSRPDAAAIAPPALGTRGLWACVALVAVIAVIYFPVRHYGFVDLDDPQYVSENPFIAQGFTWDGVKWAFTSVYASYWLPLIWLSHMLDVQLYGLNAGGHHVTNVLFHMANSVLLFALLHRMTGAVGRSAFAAALFAVHPLRVESVVWVTERKDVLSTLFLLLTVWFYVEYTRRRALRRYLLALLCLALGLLAKSMLVTVPFLLLLLDVWPLKRISLSDGPFSAKQRATTLQLVREKLPFLVIAVTSAVVTYLTQARTGAVAGIDRIPLAMRAANSTLSYGTYIVNTVWPSNLALFYPYPLAIAPGPVIASLTGLLLVTAVFLWKLKQYPYLAAGWFWYLGTLVPVIGIIQAGDQAHADRFTYVPLIGLFVIVAWGACDLIGRYRAAPIVAALVVVAYAAAARVQVDYWQTNTRLWQHALEATRESYVAHTNLGLALFVDGKTDEAIRHFRAALRLRPDFAEAHNDLGVALASRGDTDGAIQAFLDALRAKPNQAQSHYNAAVLLGRKGDTTAAVEHLQSALRLNPGYADAKRELDRLRRQ